MFVVKYRSAVAAPLAAMLLSSCAVGPDFVQPSAPDLDRYTREPLASRTSATDVKFGQSQHFANGRDIPAKWWHAARVVTTSISVCTNMLDSSNWAGFVDWLCRPHPERKWYVRAGARVYLTLLGGVLSAVEGIQKGMPGSSVSKAFAPLAPLERQPARLQANSSLS